MGPKLTEILDQMVLLKASDCYLKFEERPFFRINGEIQETKFNALIDEDMRGYMEAVMTEFQRKRFQENPDLDLAYNTERCANMAPRLFGMNIRLRWHF